MKNLKLLRKLKGASQQEVADYIGITQSAYQRYEAGMREPSFDVLRRMSEYFEVSIEDLVNDTEIPKAWIPVGDSRPELVSADSIRIPIIGRIRAGYDALAEQAIEGYMEVEPALLKRWPDASALKVWGDSMFPELREGDYVIISKQAETRPGDIAVICVNGSEGTIKRVEWSDTGLDLIPSNPAYGRQHFSPEDIESLPVVITARVVRVIRDL